MDKFPFTDAEWECIKDAAYPVLQAGLADDDAVYESMFIILQEELQNLRSKHGSHPRLLETEADFCSDDNDSIRLYEAALHLAEENSLPIASICLSYADRLIIRGVSHEAERILESCREEVYAENDKYDRETFKELMARIKATKNSDDLHNL